MEGGGGEVGTGDWEVCEDAPYRPCLLFCFSEREREGGERQTDTDRQTDI